MSVGVKRQNRGANEKISATAPFFLCESVEAAEYYAAAVANFVVADCQWWRDAECSAAIEKPIAQNTLLFEGLHCGKESLFATQLYG